MAEPEEHWLDRYGNGYYAWKSADHDGRKSFERPIGLVETSFDTDGRYFGGRADMTQLFTVRIRHRLDKEALRRRIALAWANLRLRHVMLMSRTRLDEASKQRTFVVDLRSSVEDVLKDVLRSIVWVEDHHHEVDGNEILRHALNAGRVIDPETCLSRAHVLPLVEKPDGSSELRFLTVMAHQISDGLSAFHWFSDFVRILNLSEADLTKEISTNLQEAEVKKKLPPAQEDLYPRAFKNKARERWFWALIRVLRHLRKSTPPSFPNPLRRAEKLKEAITLPPLFPSIFNYSHASKPPLTSGSVIATLSPSASARMMRLCRETHVSIGAGCFALAGLAMMTLHSEVTLKKEQQEQQEREERDEKITLPFAAGFPLNPRAFFNYHTPADSCMLAFSDGILMPFLPPHLPITSRFKLVAAHANRELRMYQKRAGTNTNTNTSTNSDSITNSKKKEPGPHPIQVRGIFDPHDPARILATAYLSAIERADAKLPPNMRRGVATHTHGTLTLAPVTNRATCGVSSIGRTAQWLASNTYSIDIDAGGKDFAADFVDLKQGVRARDDEFLVGSNTDAEGKVHFSVSYDESAISPEMAGRWRDVMEGLMEVEQETARI